jgi:hypothetical protein
VGDNVEEAEMGENVACTRKGAYWILVRNLAGRGLGVDEITLVKWLGVGWDSLAQEGFSSVDFVRLGMASTCRLILLLHGLGNGVFCLETKSLVSKGFRYGL